MSQEDAEVATGVTAIIVSVDYGDVLKLTLGRNRRLFQKCIIVTAPDDYETQAIGSMWECECLATKVFWRHGAQFNKAAGLNEALAAVETDLICTLDADIVLPAGIDSAFRNIPSRSEFLFGLNRKIATSLTELDNGAGEDRRMPYDYVTGFFQLFSVESQYFPGGFSDVYPTAGHYDVEFMVHWPVEFRRRLYDLPAMHLGERARDWYGRRVPELTAAGCRASCAGGLGELFRLTVIETSGIILLQNVSACHVPHVRLNLLYADERVTCRLGGMPGGSFVELPLHSSSNMLLSTAQIEGVHPKHGPSRDSVSVNYR